MVHKILEDNQAKLNTVCRAFLESIHGLTSVEGWSYSLFSTQFMLLFDFTQLINIFTLTSQILPLKLS